MEVKIGFGSSFKRAFKKEIYKNKELEKKFWEKLAKFKKNPFDPMRAHRKAQER